MKKTLFALLALVGIMIFVSCSDTETYADKKKKERSAINRGNEVAFSGSCVGSRIRPNIEWVKRTSTWAGGRSSA